MKFSKNIYLSKKGLVNNKEWNQELVRASFLPFEAERILSIPISRRDVEDEWCWGGSSDGLFRVKDVYALAANSTNHASCSEGRIGLGEECGLLKFSLKFASSLGGLVGILFPIE